MLVGIMSFCSPTGRTRRSWIRAMMDTTPTAAVRFVLSNATLDSDAAEADMLHFSVPESGRTLGTYLLTNAFFPFALALRPTVPLLGRADDDGLFHPPTLLAELQARGLGPNIVYGPYHEWSLWVPSALAPACFGYGPARFVNALRDVAGRLAMANSSHGGDAWPSGVSRRERECLFSDAIGPFPYAKGPLVVYSREVLARLMALPHVLEDEAYALGKRKRQPLRSTINGKVYNSSSFMHPRRQVVYDDIYCLRPTCLEPIASVRIAASPASCADEPSTPLLHSPIRA